MDLNDDNSDDMKKLKKKLEKLKEFLDNMSPEDIKEFRESCQINFVSSLDDRRIFASIIYDDITIRNYYPEPGSLVEAIDYFIESEEYEKCAIIKNLIDTRYK